MGRLPADGLPVIIVVRVGLVRVGLVRVGLVAVQKDDLLPPAQGPARPGLASGGLPPPLSPPPTSLRTPPACSTADTPSIENHRRHRNGKAMEWGVAPPSIDNNRRQWYGKVGGLAVAEATRACRALGVLAGQRLQLENVRGAVHRLCDGAEAFGERGR